MKQLLRSCCNTKLIRTVSHNFSFVGNPVIFSPDDGDSMFLRNIGIYAWVYITSHCRRATSSCSPTWEPQMYRVYWLARNYMDELINYMKPVLCNWFTLCMTRLNTVHFYIMKLVREKLKSYITQCSSVCRIWKRIDPSVSQHWWGIHGGGGGDIVTETPPHPTS
jgi:hypothetical protein